jgi:hypothetical protein
MSVLRAASMGILSAIVIAGFVMGGVYIWQHGRDIPNVSAGPEPNQNLALAAARQARTHAMPGLPRLMLIGNSVARYPRVGSRRPSLHRFGTR